MSSPVRWRAPHAARCPFPDAVLLDPPCAAPWLCHQRDGPRRFFVRALPPRAAFLAARGFTCALDPVCVSRCSVRKGLTRRFSGSDDACRFLQRYDTRAHPGDERSNLHPERDRDLFRARRVVAHPAGERRRRDASVARCRPRLREQRPGTRHGPLLVRTLEHPSHRRGPLRGLESLATRHVGRDRPPPPPREGRRIEVNEVLSTLPEPPGKMPLHREPAPPSRRPSLSCWALLMRVAPLFPLQERLALASQAPRGGSVGPTQAALAALFRCSCVSSAVGVLDRSARNGFCVRISSRAGVPRTS